MSNTYPKGSEWRRWDLHIHTPESALNNQFTDWGSYLDALEGGADRVAVIGITDYASIAGYERVVQERATRTGLQGFALILPNIELRIFPETREGKGINLHLLVDPTEDDHIHHIKSALGRLTFKFRDLTYACTPADLTRLGNAFNSALDGKSALREGCNQFKPSFDKFKEWWDSEGWLNRNSIIVTANSSSDGASGVQHDNGFRALREELYRFTHAIFSGNPRDRTYFLGDGPDSKELIREKYRQLKPCIHGSDAHKEDKLFQPDEDRYCWIKADPTFGGLRQVLNEPSDRVWIGLEPEQLIRIQRNPTRIATNIEIRKLPDARTTDVWFDSSLPLNPGLIAVVGKKGSGKSALSDIIALAGDTDRTEFSFLTKGRFRDPRKRLAEQFEATLTWRGGSPSGPVSLNDDPDPQAVRRVHYIPQSFLEQICNDIGVGKKDRFYEELQTVIFSHIPEGERFACSSLKELIELKSEENQRAIRILKTELDRLNSTIERATSQLKPSNRTALEGRYRAAWEEISALRATGRPARVNRPPSDPAQEPTIKAAAEKLASLRSKRRIFSTQEVRISAIRDRNQRRAEDARKLLGRIKNLKDAFEASYPGIKELASLLDLDPSRIAKLSTNSAPVEEIRDRAIAVVAWANNLLSLDNHGSIASKSNSNATEMRAESEKLSLPQRRYEAYVEDYQVWKSQVLELVGSESDPESARGIKKSLEDLEKLPTKISELEQARDGVVSQIFAEKDALRREFETLHRPVQEFIDGFPDFGGEARLSFSVHIQDEQFSDKLLTHIHQGKTGSFMGQEEGLEYANNLIDSADLQTEAGVKQFVASVCDALNYDQRVEGRPRRSISDQLREGFEPRTLANFVHGLDYLEPRFEIRWGGRPLGQLSPGEKGNLLLMFYLLVDKSEIPLIIDQPEENLDNETVFDTLVPCVRVARNRRQVILVTHNPNLAVVCDADQVIHAKIDKGNGNRVTYQSGAIEDPSINRCLVDVLEGTRPAFDLREAKYEVSNL
jgi:ABC-type lipoprotein export system ATPase subunit